MNSVINKHGIYQCHKDGAVALMRKLIEIGMTISKGYVVPVFIMFLFSSPVYAGMPTPELIITIFPSMRVSTISFFVFVILMVALTIKLLWNYLRQDFPRMPFITYKKSLVLVFLLGLLFNVVLFMIAGARELMTPGAWELAGRSSVTYRLYYGLGSNPELTEISDFMNPEAPWEQTENKNIYRLKPQLIMTQPVSESEAVENSDLINPETPGQTERSMPFKMRQQRVGVTEQKSQIQEEVE